MTTTDVYFECTIERARILGLVQILREESCMYNSVRKMTKGKGDRVEGGRKGGRRKERESYYYY